MFGFLINVKSYITLTYAKIVIILYVAIFMSLLPFFVNSLLYKLTDILISSLKLTGPYNLIGPVTNRTSI